MLARVFSFGIGKRRLIKETVSQLNGRCFTVYDLEEYFPRMGPWFLFNFQHDISLYLLNRGAEMFLTGLNEFPNSVSTETLKISENFNIAVITYEEIHSSYTSKRERPCKVYSDDHELDHEMFINCSKNELWKLVSANISCAIPDLKVITPDDGVMEECSNQSIAWDTFWMYEQILGDFSQQPWRYGCPQPCKIVTYKIRLEYFHKNNIMRSVDMPNISNGQFLLFTYYSALAVQERIESLEYDLGSLLVAAGGNLGLFLGLSAFSGLLLIINWCKRLTLPMKSNCWSDRVSKFRKKIALKTRNSNATMNP